MTSVQYCHNNKVFLHTYASRLLIFARAGRKQRWRGERGRSRRHGRLGTQEADVVALLKAVSFGTAGDALWLTMIRSMRSSRSASFG